MPADSSELECAVTPSAALLMRVSLLRDLYQELTATSLTRRRDGAGMGKIELDLTRCTPPAPGKHSGISRDPFWLLHGFSR